MAIYKCSILHRKQNVKQTISFSVQLYQHENGNNSNKNNNNDALLSHNTNCMSDINVQKYESLECQHVCLCLRVLQKVLTYPKCRFFCWCDASWRWQWKALSHTLHVKDSSVNDNNKKHKKITEIEEKTYVYIYIHTQNLICAKGRVEQQQKNTHTTCSNQRLLLQFSVSSRCRQNVPM